MYETDTFEFLDLLHMIWRVYESAFVEHNIQNAFKVASLFPVHTCKFLNTAWPKNAEEADVMISADHLMDLLHAKWERLKAGDCLQPVLLKLGHIKCGNGILVTADYSFLLIKEAEEESQRK